MIIAENYEYLKQHHADLLSLTITDVCAGTYLLAVRLSDGAMGVSSSERDKDIHCDVKDRDYGEFTPLKITGRTVAQLFENPKRSALVNALSIAVLNAIGSQMIEKQGYKIVRNTDPIDLIDINEPKKITLVGAFHSYIRKVNMVNRTLKVLELNESALLPEHRQFYVPAERYQEILPDSDVVMITGLTLVNRTFDDLLNACNPKTNIIVVGPSSNIIPSVLFQKKVDIIGGTMITQKDLLFDLVGQGAAGYHLFKYCAEKICVLNE
jgi:uncharacterized protein (DUF4213/DUF364 family)